MRNLILNIGLLAVICVSAMPTIAEEDYYVWVDENGVTNYAQRNPQGYDADYVSRNRQFGQQVDPRRPGAAPVEVESSSRPDTIKQTKAVDPDALVAEERAALSAKISATKRSNCEIGKKNLAQLQAFSRIRVQDKNGVNRVLTSSEKDDKMTEARLVISDNCSD